MNIEVERRAVVDQDTWQALSKTLKTSGAEDLDDDDTETTFYLTDTWQAKVQRRLAPGGEAKIAWKSGGNDGAAQRKEIEVPIDVAHIGEANQLVAALAPQAKVFETLQRRHDYRLDGVGIAVKHSDDWGYHVEFDMVIEDDARAAEAIRQIEAVADKLGVRLLSADEEKQLVESKIKERLAEG